jgi:predicted RNA binding protein YcfA (HicA-like mRNA interferase family)
MNRLPMLNARKVIQALERGGFFVDHTTGSHHRLKHLTHRVNAIVIRPHRAAHR